MHTDVTYFLSCQQLLIVHFIHVQHLYMLRVHLPKHWFHMVLETGYKHLRHQMESVSERRKWVVWFEASHSSLKMLEKACVILCNSKPRVYMYARLRLSLQGDSWFEFVTVPLAILQTNSRGCGYVESRNQTSELMLTEWVFYGWFPRASSQ